MKEKNPRRQGCNSEAEKRGEMRRNLGGTVNRTQDCWMGEGVRVSEESRVTLRCLAPISD